MRDVGDWCAFAALGVMQTRGKLKGKFKTQRQGWHPDGMGEPSPLEMSGNDTSNSLLYLSLNSGS